MKKRILALISIGCISILLISGGVAIKKHYDKMNMLDSKPQTMGSTEAQENKDKILNTIIEDITSSIPSNVFGGIYLDDKQNIIVNITDESIVSSINSISYENYNIVYKIVKYPLCELEYIVSLISNEMKNYSISSLYVDIVENKINIVLRSENEDIYSLTDSLIERQDINFTILPENTLLQPT